MLPSCGYGFRVRDFVAPRNDAGIANAPPLGLNRAPSVPSFFLSLTHGRGTERRLALHQILPPCGGRRLLRSRRRALRRSIAALFRIPGHAFQTAFAPHDQPAPGGRSVVTSRWSPEPPECGMPSTSGDRVSESFRVRPEVSAAHLHRVPPACSATKTPHDDAPRRAGCFGI